MVNAQNEAQNAGEFSDCWWLFRMLHVSRRDDRLAEEEEEEEEEERKKEDEQF